MYKHRCIYKINVYVYRCIYKINLDIANIAERERVRTHARERASSFLWQSIRGCKGT